MSDMPIGALRRRVTLEAEMRASDGAGGATVSWVPVAELWAYVRGITGGEVSASDALGGRVTHEIWIRHREDVGPDKRFSMGARVFDIRAAVDREGRTRWLKCQCEETVP